MGGDWAQVAEDLAPLDAIQRYARSDWDVQRLAYIRGIAVAAAVAGWRESRNLLPLLRELVGLPDTAVRQALASQLTPMGAFSACMRQPWSVYSYISLPETCYWVLQPSHGRRMGAKPGTQTPWNCSTWACT